MTGETIFGGSDNYFEIPVLDTKGFQVEVETGTWVAGSMKVLENTQFRFCNIKIKHGDTEFDFPGEFLIVHVKGMKDRNVLLAPREDAVETREGRRYVKDHPVHLLSFSLYMITFRAVWGTYTHYRDHRPKGHTLH